MQHKNTNLTFLRRVICPLNVLIFKEDNIFYFWWKWRKVKYVYIFSLNPLSTKVDLKILQNFPSQCSNSTRPFIASLVVLICTCKEIILVLANKMIICNERIKSHAEITRLCVGVMLEVIGVIYAKYCPNLDICNCSSNQTCPKH